MKREIDPYRYFFPAGWLLGLWGVFLWVLFPWGIVGYPGAHHPEVMMGGFFLCFVAGFLMTAAPRFTSTWGATDREHRISGFLICLLLVAAIWFHRVLFFSIVCAIFLFLIRYMMVRFLERKSNPPDSFVFLGFGLGTGLFGALILLSADYLAVPYYLLHLARTFFLNTYIMCLVIGVGSRLIPALMGFTPLPTERISVGKNQRVLFVVLGILFLVSYILESSWSIRGGYFVRSVVLSYILILIWRIYKPPKRSGVQTWGLSLSAWSVLFGHWGVVIFEAYRVHLVHLILISGLGLMTLMIAARVSLSHGNHDMSLERNSKTLAVGGVLVLLAGFTRLSAGFASHIYESHLLYAAITWILGLAIWGLLFLPKIIQIQPKDGGHK